MAVEIEIKAWVRRQEETLRLIEKLCVFETAYVKDDEYFKAPASSFDLRVRSENGKWICTFKEKSVRNGLEVNGEKEFALSDGTLFMDLLKRLGCERSIRKRKTGKRYSCQGLTVEVSDVKNLGLFVEAEKVLDTASQKDIRIWEKTIRRFLAGIGIRDEDIEERPYSLMLAEKNKLQG
jgi:adenylate cyclase class 2